MYRIEAAMTNISNMARRIRLVYEGRHKQQPLSLFELMIVYNYSKPDKFALTF